MRLIKLYSMPEPNAILRRKTPTVWVGSVPIGSEHPIVVQSMTNTPTHQISATVKQITSLAKTGSDLVRLAINDEPAMAAIPKIVNQLKSEGLTIPLIGDFHFNGHLLLEKYPKSAALLAKYRINPGNVGQGTRHDENFERFIRMAKDHKKAVRIGVNAGSLDPELFKKLSEQNLKKESPLTANELLQKALVQSALQSARAAQASGMAKEQIVLSLKMSDVRSLVSVYQNLAPQCDYVLHVGLTEAGLGVQGVTASTAALSILLAQGIGDTIRVSLTPDLKTGREQEVRVCCALLQALGLRYFMPQIISCPGCGRTKNKAYLKLAETVHRFVESHPEWRAKYPKSSRIKIAVMGCIVNGPGESRQADIGISLPGRMEAPKCPVYIKGKLFKTLTGANIDQQFLKILKSFITQL